MCEIKEIINLLPLSESDKIHFYEKIKEEDINNIKFLQGNIYIFLNSGKMIRLKNATNEVYMLLQKIEKLSTKEISMDKNTTIKTWSIEELNFLKENYKEYSVEELAKILKKSLYQIEAKKISLKLYEIKPWEDKEIEFLIKNKNESLYFLSMKLNRSIASIKAKKRKENI